MSDSILSQDELDALMQGTSLESNDSDSLNSSEEVALNGLFKEIGEARVAALSQLTGATVTFEDSVLLTGTKEKIVEDLGTAIVGNASSITGNITGSWTIGAPENTVFQVANPMTGTEATEVNEEVISAFGEAISTLVGSDITVLSQKLGMTLSPSLVETQSYENGDAFIDATGTLCRIGMHINIGGASYVLYTVSSINFIKSIAKILSPSASSPTENNTADNPNGNNPNAVNMTPAQFQQFSPSGNIEAVDNLALLLDVPMRVTVELGRTRMTIKDILNLGEGSIVELEKLAGEPVDVLVNDKLIALGEVVVIDENFSVRVTKVVTPMERIFDRENLHGKGGV